MGIFDKLFGSDDPITTELDRVEKKKKDKLKKLKEQDDTDGNQEYELESLDKDDFPPENILFGEKCWPYEFEPADSVKLSGRELYTLDEMNNHYMGEDIRALIENRRYAPEDATRIGYTKDNVKGVQDVYIDHDALFRHIALFGQTGYGKSTLMRNMLLQWINAGFGICYVDPKGDDSKELLEQLPPHRVDDIVWVEPGSDREKQVGFNVFDTAASPNDPRYEREVNSVAGDFIQILKDKSEYWGPQIGNITETLVQQLIRANEPFNPIDLVKIITDEEERKLFAENYGDDLEQVFMKRVAEQDDDAFEPILRRVREWVSDRETRQVMAHAKSKINISEVVRDDKILIVNTASIENPSTKEIITRMVIARIWSAVRTRKTDNNSDPDPFFLCIDEFDKVISDNFDINSIVSQARSFRLSVFVANQQPSQLPKETKTALQQVQSLLSFNPGGHPGDAQDIAHVLGDVDAWELGDLDRFTVVGRPYMNDSQQPAIIINTYGEYPPLRTPEEAEAIINRSLNKYGSKPHVETNLDKYGVKRFIDSDDIGHTINDMGDTITTEQLLECIYTSQIRNETIEIDGKEDWVNLEQITNEVEKYVGSMEGAYASKLSNVLEVISDSDVERRVSDSAYYRLTDEGKQKAFEPDTGSAASGGKSPHRILLRKGHTAFTKLGYDVTLPSQDKSGRLPDGVAKTPINPMKESNNFEEAVEKEKELVQEYPRLAQLFGDKDVSLEAESTTITRPAQTIKNLIKAIQDNQHCVFLVKDGTRKKGSFDYWARVGTDILTDPPFVRSVDEHGNRTFYTTNGKVSLANKSTALVKKDAGQVSWTEYGKQYQDPSSDKIHLKLETSNEDTPIAKFEDAAELSRNPSPSKFPYNYYRDTQSKETIVKDKDGEIVDRYDNLKEMRKEGKYKVIHMPIIPDYEFPDGKYPSPNDWTFVIIPESENKGPQIYSNGEMEPLLPEDGAKINPNDFGDLNINLDVQKLIPEEQLENEFDKIVNQNDTDLLTEGPDISDNTENIHINQDNFSPNDLDNLNNSAEDEQLEYDETEDEDTGEIDGSKTKEESKVKPDEDIDNDENEEDEQLEDEVDSEKEDSEPEGLNLTDVVNIGYDEEKVPIDEEDEDNETEDEDTGEIDGSKTEEESKVKPDENEEDENMDNDENEEDDGELYDRFKLP